MVRNVDQINITNWAELGTTAPINQYSFNIEIKWTRNDGTAGQHSSTRIFPNALSVMPLSARRYFVEQMIMSIVRVELGIDTWDNYQ